MEPHQPRHPKSDAEGLGRPRTRRDALPLDAAWLEREAIGYVAQWETTRHGLSGVLERRLRARCERTNEDPSTILDRIPEVVDRLVGRGYVDDERFAEQQIERGRRQGWSRARIRARLEAKGVDPASFDALEARLREARSERRTSDFDAAPESPIDEDLEAAWRTARKRRLGPYAKDPNERVERRQRHLAVLARQGFSQDIAYRVIDAKSPLEIDRPETDGCETGR